MSFTGQTRNQICDKNNNIVNNITKYSCFNNLNNVHNLYKIYHIIFLGCGHICIPTY